MKTERAPLHMCLAAYLSPDPHSQVLKMAKRVQRTTISKRTKATMKHVISSPVPAAVVLHVHEGDD